MQPQDMKTSLLEFGPQLFQEVAAVMAEVFVQGRIDFGPRWNKKTEPAFSGRQELAIGREFRGIITNVLEHVDADDGIKCRRGTKRIDRALDELLAGEVFSKFGAELRIGFDRNDFFNLGPGHQVSCILTDPRTDFQHVAARGNGEFPEDRLTIILRQVERFKFKISFERRFVWRFDHGMARSYI